MTGSLQIKNGTYYAVLYIPDQNGKKHQKWISTKLKVAGSNKREAQRMVRNLIVEYEHKKIVYTPKVLFVDWIDQWLEQKKHEIDQVTYEGYLIFVRQHVRPYFEPKKLALIDVTAQHIQSYYNDKLEHGRLDGKGGLSAKSIKKHNVVLRGALEDAVKKGLIPYNPADRATLPKLQRFTGKFYTVEQAQELLRKAQGHVLYPVVLLTVFYGLRRSEVAGLKWDAVNFTEDTLIIRNTIVKVTHTIEKERTKNKKSYRTLPLIPEVKEYLLQLKKQQAENRRLLGTEYEDNGHVCVWPDGRILHPDYITGSFSELLKKLGMPKIRFHDLRHTTASILIAKGFSLKEIQEWLGHEDISTTADIYGHLDYRQKLNIADHMGEFLNLSEHETDKG